MRNRVLIGTSTAPMRMTASAAQIHSGRFIIHSETLSPGAIPRAMRPRATASISRASSANVQRRSSKTRASRAPSCARRSSTSEPIVRFGNQ